MGKRIHFSTGRLAIGLGALLFVWAGSGCSGASEDGSAPGNEDAPVADGTPPASGDAPASDDTPDGDPHTKSKVPAKVLDLKNWKETLPTGSDEEPKEVTQPSLATFSVSPYFKVNATGDAVQFRAPTNGVTTSGSGYPRSELREMTDDGKSNASWSTTSGTHTMEIDEAITAVPKKKKHIVAGQIHNEDDDVIVIRLESPKLFVDINGKTGPTLEDNYKLGTRFKVKFVASNGKIKIYYNGDSSPAYTLSKSSSGCYFKVGAYTQSNCDTESSCGSSNYGEVNVYSVKVTHD